MLLAVNSEPAHERGAVDHLWWGIARGPGRPSHAHPAWWDWLAVLSCLWCHDLRKADACAADVNGLLLC